MIYFSKPEHLKIDLEVVGCFLEHNGEILLLHRQDNKPQGNTWGTPGGKVDPGENLVDACIREVFEESDVAIDNPIFSQTVYVNYPGEFTFAYHLFSFKLSNRPNIKIKMNEHKDFVWKTPEEALKMDLIKDEDWCVRLFYGL